MWQAHPSYFGNLDLKYSDTEAFLSNLDLKALDKGFLSISHCIGRTCGLLVPTKTMESGELAGILTRVNMS